MKWCKFLVGWLLLPVCAGAVLALAEVLQRAGGADLFWVPLLAGMACWGVVFALLPRPMWVYVLGHELTHALWAWLFGGEVKRLKVTARGGHVVVTRSNFLIALAPYFFPLYAAVVVAVYAVGNLVADWRPYAPVFHLLLGFTYAFHLTLTFCVLQTRQTDITEHGYLFSGAVIFLGNVALLLVGLPLLTAHGSVGGAMRAWAEGVTIVLRWLGQWLPV